MSEVGPGDVTPTLPSCTYALIGRRYHFNPGSRLWKGSDSGTTCFVNASRNTFTDVGDRGGTGGPAKFMALKENAISWPEERADGRAYWAGVKALREDGFDIPV